MATSPVFPQYSSLFTSGLLCHDTPSRNVDSRLARSPSLLSHSPGSFGACIDASLSQSEPQDRHLAIPKRSATYHNNDRSFLSLDPTNGREPTLASQPSQHTLRRIKSLGSREKLNLPSAKPAPSVSLPEVPSKPRPSKLLLTFSTHHSATQTENHSLGSEDTPFSPSLDSSPMLSPGESRSWLHFSPSSTPPLTAESEFSAYSYDTLSSSASPYIPFPVSLPVNSCQRNRSAALATLEGRSPCRATPSRPSSNFINLTDEEEYTIRGPGEEHSCRRSRKSSATVDDDFRRPSSLMRLRSRVDSCLSSLSSFIDLKEDSELPSSKSYRSFVEFGP